MKVILRYIILDHIYTVADTAFTERIAKEDNSYKFLQHLHLPFHSYLLSSVTARGAGTARHLTGT